MTCFQSRFGPEEWLQPYTDKTVEKLAQEGVKSIARPQPRASSPTASKTLEEIAGEAAEIFHEAGGENFAHIPCLKRQRAWHGRDRGDGPSRTQGLDRLTGKSGQGNGISRHAGAALKHPGFSRSPK